MAGKAKPFTPEQWPQVVVDAFQILSDNNWVPCATLIIGLPGEQEEDVQLTIDLVEKLHDYKSLIVPLFMVSEGGLKDKTTSFTIDTITRKQSELFLKCWEHNLDWSNSFLREYFVTQGSKGYGLRIIFKYGIAEAKKLIRICREDYEYDLPTMIKDAREGKISVGSVPAPFSVSIIESEEERRPSNHESFNVV